MAAMYDVVYGLGCFECRSALIVPEGRTQVQVELSSNTSLESFLECLADSANDLTIFILFPCCTKGLYYRVCRMVSTSAAGRRAIVIEAFHLARLHTILALAAFFTSLALGCFFHYKKIVKNGVAGYPEEWFPSVSATSVCSLAHSTRLSHILTALAL